jgi:Na+/proline symporter
MLASITRKVCPTGKTAELKLSNCRYRKVRILLLLHQGGLLAPLVHFSLQQAGGDIMTTTAISVLIFICIVGATIVLSILLTDAMDRDREGQAVGIWLFIFLMLCTFVFVGILGNNFGTEHGARLHAQGLIVVDTLSNGETVVTEIKKK